MSTDKHRRRIGLKLSESQVSLKELSQRHDTMKKDWEWAGANQKKPNDSLLHLSAKVKKRDQQVLELKSALASSKEEPM